LSRLSEFEDELHADAAGKPPGPWRVAGVVEELIGDVAETLAEFCLMVEVERADGEPALMFGRVRVAADDGQAGLLDQRLVL
jgi:hypothetical protein